jgi:hypothetical protein
MALHEWTLLSPATTTNCDDFTLSACEIPGTPVGWQVRRKRLSFGLSQGVDLVEIDNGRLRVAIIPTRGMGLWRAWMDGKDLGWQSPVRGPVHPSFVPIAEPNGLGWLSGFDELMCRCGLDSNGSPDFDEQGRLRYPLHGRIANCPAHEVRLTIDDVEGSISLQGVVEESRVHFQKLRLRTTYRTRFDCNQIEWRDEVENFGGCEAQMQMLYHTNIGQPQLEAGSALIAPLTWIAPANAETAAAGVEKWNYYTAPDPRFREQVYQLGLVADDRDQTHVLLKNAAGRSGVQLSYNIRELPYLTLWRNLTAAENGYVTGIEPGTNYPNPRSVETNQGRFVTLPAQQRWAAGVSLEWIVEPGAVENSENRIGEIQGGRRVQILPMDVGRK